MRRTVATPLERALGRIAGVTEMTSSSSLGNARITPAVRPEPRHRRRGGATCRRRSTPLAAATDQPAAHPTYRKVNPADAPIMILALTSDTMDRGQLYDARRRSWPAHLAGERSRPGDGRRRVATGGARRAEPHPRSTATASRSTTCASRSRRRTPNRPKGSVEDGDRHWQIQANDQAKKASEYIPLIVAYRNGAAVRLSDVGEVVDSVEDLRNAGSSNGKPSVLLIINRQPNANIIGDRRARARLMRCCARRSRARSTSTWARAHQQIRASLREVERTLMIAMALVILVVFAFLRNARATLIPAVAVPVVAGDDLRRDVSVRVQPEQPVADGPHHRHRLRGRRRDCRAGERLAPHRAGAHALPGGLAGREAGQLQPCCR